MNLHDRRGRLDLPETPGVGGDVVHTGASRCPAIASAAWRSPSRAVDERGDTDETIERRVEVPLDRFTIGAEYRFLKSRDLDGPGNLQDFQLEGHVVSLVGSVAF